MSDTTETTAKSERRTLLQGTTLEYVETLGSSWDAPSKVRLRIATRDGTPIVDLIYAFDGTSEVPDATCSISTIEHDLLTKGPLGIVHLDVICEVSRMLAENQRGEFYTSAFEDDDGNDRKLPFENRFGGLYQWADDPEPAAPAEAPAGV